MKLLHVIHDFLPRHRAGAEIYVQRLCHAQRPRQRLALLCADYDPATPHGTLRLRGVDGLPVHELVNNWAFSRFEQTYADPALGRTLAGLLDRLRPDLVHLHNLLGLTLELPLLARQRGIPTVATLHDYALLCPAGGQCLSPLDGARCRRIEPQRCARCFAASAYGQRFGIGPLARRGPLALTAGRALARLSGRLVPGLQGKLGALAGRSGAAALSPEAIRRRLELVHRAVDAVELMVAPSAALAEEIQRLGLRPRRLRVSDYGTPELGLRGRGPRRPAEPLVLGFVGTLAPHKGAHLLLEALARLVERQPRSSAATGRGGEARGGLRLLVFGDPATHPAYAAALRRTARTRGLPVRFCGPFAPKQVAAVYRRLHALVVPSLWAENSPLVVHEALAAGLPVVAARSGGLAELVRPGQDGLLVAPGDAGDLAEALGRLRDEPGLLPRLAAKTRAPRSMADDAAFWDQRYAELARPARHRAGDGVTPPENEARQPRATAAPAEPGPSPRWTDRPDVSLLLLCRDGARTLPALLERLAEQRCDASLELVALDSGSRDGSLDLLRRAGARLHTIPPHRFNHGRSRTLGASLCRGELVLLLAQDALPADRRFVARLVAPLGADPRLAGSHGRQVPRPEASPLVRFYAERGLPFQPAPGPRFVADAAALAAASPLERYRLCHFDTVCACVRRALLEAHPFPAAAFGEDIAWARAVLLAGYGLTYVPGAVVYHSHQRPLGYELNRTYLAHRQLRALFGLRTVPTPAHLALAVGGTLASNLRCLAAQPPRVALGESGRALGLALALPLGQYLGALAADSGLDLLPGGGV